MMLSKVICAIIAFVPLTIASPLQLDVESPPRYSKCFADRGYTKDEALIATDFLVNNATFEDGRYLRVHECIYKSVNTTVLSVCNGSYRNRTIYRPEVRRGFEQLQQDCGAGGTFNGIHVVNNLTFAAYGTSGPILGTAPSLPPSTIGKDLAPHQPKPLAPKHVVSGDPQDPCRALAFNGKSQYNCLHVYNLAADGTCDGRRTGMNGCSVYCEVRRTGFMGVEQQPEGPAGAPFNAGVGYEIAEGVETTVSHGISTSAAGIFSEVFEAGVNYNFEYSTTKTFTITRAAGDVPEGKVGYWVYFPLFIETCGTITKANRIDVPGMESYCGDKVESFGNQCTVTPYMIDGKNVVQWAMRWTSKETGEILPISQQSESYKEQCAPVGFPAGDPDNDGEKECPGPVRL